ncbi:T9SS type A sorting domain-containing protein [Flavobacteriaceae bacterium]|nr:T9SS type A sorting domain-containing protein [Flavobacteriaceae bacterium]
MKKITLLLMMLTISFSYAQDLPLDFETSPVTADMEGFDGGVITVEAVVSPQSTGNTSTNLAKLVKGAGQPWAGAKIVLDTPFDFSTNSNIEVRIYTTAPINSKIEFKAEGVGANSGAKLAYTTKTGEWETLTFDFSGVTATNLTDLIMIPYMPGDAQGDGSEAATFYFDDIIQTAPPAATCVDGIQNGDETGIDCGGPACDACPEVKLPLDFSDASQLFTYNNAGSGGGSVVMEGGQMRFNGNGHAYDQAYLDLTSPISLMDQANNTITVTMNPLLVPDGEVRTHLFKVQLDPLSGAVREVQGQSIGSGEQDVTFNFGDVGADVWGRIILFMDFGQQGTGSDYNGIVTDYLISSITLGADPVIVQVPPTGAAPTPPARNAADVVSVYSRITETTNVYADIAGIDFPSWGGNSGNTSSEAFESDLALKLPAFTFQGVTLGAGVDLSGMTMLHLDIWAQTQSVGLNLIASVGGEQGVNIASNDGEWSSVDIALSDFTDQGIVLDNVIQMKFKGIPANADGTLDIYLDNIYFYTGVPLSLDNNNILNVNLYPNPAKGVVNFSSASNAALDVSVYDMLGKQVLRAEAVQSQLNISSLNPGMYFVKMTQGSNSSTKKLVVK